jgi:hypothetical protein
VFNYRLDLLHNSFRPGCSRTGIAAGASAALVGLVIVAISVNIQRILEQPQLPSRGGATVATLVLVLVSSIAELASINHK